MWGVGHGAGTKDWCYFYHAHRNSPGYWTSLCCKVGEAITNTKQSIFTKVCSNCKKSFLLFHRIYFCFTLKCLHIIIVPRTDKNRKAQWAPIFQLSSEAKGKGQSLRSDWGRSMGCSWSHLELGPPPQPLKEFREEMGMKCLSKCMNGITNRRLLRLSGHPHAQKRGTEGTPTSLDWADIQTWKSNSRIKGESFTV